jgi:phage repressor protein C with HTH and peptisase S24 domain
LSRPGENLAGIAVLQRGETLVCRPHGNSMRPRIANGALVTIEPLKADDLVAVDDVVLCKVRGRVMLHLVKAVRPDGQVLIGNNHGYINGWTSRAKCYGRVVKVES